MLKITKHVFVFNLSYTYLNYVYAKCINHIQVLCKDFAIFFTCPTLHVKILPFSLYVFKICKDFAVFFTCYFIRFFIPPNQSHLFCQLPNEKHFQSIYTIHDLNRSFLCQFFVSSAIHVLRVD